MTNSDRGPQKFTDNRRRKFIRKDLQLKMTLGTLFVSLTILFFNFQIPFVGLWIYSQGAPVDGPELSSQMNRLILVSFFLSVLLTVPLAIWMGVIFAFQFCGPIYAIKRYFVGFKEGVWTGSLRLREKDDLKDLRDVINQSVELVKERLTGQNDVLDEVESILREVELPEASRERVSALLDRIAVEKAEFDRRFPLPRGNGDKLEEPKSESDEESRGAGSRDCPSEEETTQSEPSLTGTSA